jgi:DNA-binding LytR/AlgR family response regulator
VPTARSLKTGLVVLVVDDEGPARDYLADLLEADYRVRLVLQAADGVSALRLLREQTIDGVFLDVTMPDLDGLELGELLAKLRRPPAIVYVTAYEQHALRAFTVGAVDYLVKPVRRERLADALGRVAGRRVSAEGGGGDNMAVLAVESQGRTVFLRRDDVHFVEAQGDYVKLHTTSGEHVLRMPLSRLAQSWADGGFARIHRGFLVSLRYVLELRDDPLGGVLARVAVGPGHVRDLPVSRRHVRSLKQRLVGGDVAGGRRRDQANPAPDEGAPS